MDSRVETKDRRRPPVDNLKASVEIDGLRMRQRLLPLLPPSLDDLDGPMVLLVASDPLLMIGSQVMAMSTVDD